MLYDGATHAAQFLPAEALREGAVYTVTVTTGLRDTSGNSLAAPYRWPSTTEVQEQWIYLPLVVKHSP